MKKVDTQQPSMLQPKPAGELAKRIPSLVSPDGRFLAIAEDNGRIALWSMTDYSKKHTFEVGAAGVTEMGFENAEPAQRFGVSTSDGRLFTWGLQSWEELPVEGKTLAEALGVPAEERDRCIKKSPEKNWANYDVLVLDTLLNCLSSVNRPLTPQDIASLPQSRNFDQDPLTATIISARRSAMNGNFDEASTKMAKALSIEKERALKTIVYSFLNEAYLLTVQSPEGTDPDTKSDPATVAKRRLATAQQMALGDPTLLDAVKRADETLRKRQEILKDEKKRRASELINEANDSLSAGNKDEARAKYQEAKLLDPSMVLNVEEQIKKRGSKMPTAPNSLSSPSPTIPPAVSPRSP